MESFVRKTITVDLQDRGTGRERGTEVLTKLFTADITSIISSLYHQMAPYPPYPAGGGGGSVHAQV